MPNDKLSTTKKVVVGVDVAVHRDVHDKLNRELDDVIACSNFTTERLIGLKHHLNHCEECMQNNRPTGCSEFRKLLTELVGLSYVPFAKRFRRWVRKGMRVQYKPDFFDPVPRTHTW